MFPAPKYVYVNKKKNGESVREMVNDYPEVKSYKGGFFYDIGAKRADALFPFKHLSQPRKGEEGSL